MVAEDVGPLEDEPLAVEGDLGDVRLDVDDGRVEHAVDLDTGDVTYRVPAGWTIATLLPLLNTSVAPGLEVWNPDRWNRYRLADADALPSPMLVTAFGHGRHSCPAQPFSLTAMTTLPKAVI